jgi:hypothetical protein
MGPRHGRSTIEWCGGAPQFDPQSGKNRDFNELQLSEACPCLPMFLQTHTTVASSPATPSATPTPKDGFAHRIFSTLPNCRADPSGRGTYLDSKSLARNAIGPLMATAWLGPPACPPTLHVRVACLGIDRCATAACHHALFWLERF